MHYATMQNFIQLISTNTGLYIREQDRNDLCNKIYTRMKLLKLTTPEEYYQLLNTKNEQVFSRETPSTREWKELTLLLTTGETYFFRDQGLFALLRNRILPELIEFKKTYTIGESKRSLRIWSAGCSTGEEPYSLAILVKELITDLSGWNILILGTDLNPESIVKAKQGLYDDWSFRTVKPELKKQYFYHRNNSWEVDEKIRSMVKLSCGNLIQDSFPSSISDIHSMDIILCRNVFIYFDSNAIATVLDKFYNTLNPGGYLIAGHTELHGQNLGQLQLKAFPESLVYQRVKTSAISSPPKTPLLTKAEKQLDCVKENTENQAFLQSKLASNSHKHNNFILTQIPQRSLTKAKETSKETTPQILLIQAETLLNAGDYTNAIKRAEEIIKQHPKHFDAYYLIAQVLANLGEQEKAINWCQQALTLEPLAVKPYYLLAHIAEEKGDFEQAKNLFKKIIYLAPSSISAYLEIAALYESEGDNTRARKMRETALDLLTRLPPDVVIEPYKQDTARELVILVTKILKTSS